MKLSENLQAVIFIIFMNAALITMLLGFGIFANWDWSILTDLGSWEKEIRAGFYMLMVAVNAIMFGAWSEGAFKDKK